MRDVLIELFDREFVESQEAVGMSVLGQFRDLDRPDQFVWLRGFPDMAARRRGLEAFYSGPVWKEHSEAANATMIDVSNVLPLRPARPGAGFDLDTAARPALGADEPAATVIATILHLDGTAAPDVAAPFFVTERRPNDFPALPVREDANVVVAFDRVGAPAPDAIADRLRGEPELLRLAPTARSLLR
jgi:hypothetical protein